MVKKRNFKRLSTEYDLKCLTNKWVFMTLEKFVESFTDCLEDDGIAHFLYVNNKFSLYEDREAVDGYCIHKYESQGLDADEIAKRLIAEFSTLEYHLFAVLWFNR